MAHVCTFVLLVMGIFTPLAEPSTILMIPCSHYSYINTFTVFGKTLISAGHKVHMVTIEDVVPKVEKAGIKAIPYTIPDEINHQKVFIPMMIRKFKGEVGNWEFMKVAVKALKDSCESILSNENIWNAIKDTEYDLVVLDGIFVCNYIYPYRLGVPYLTIAYGHDPWTAGVPAMPSTETVHGVIQYNPRQMTFFQRTVNFFMYVIRANAASLMMDEEFTTRFAPEKTAVKPSDIRAKSDMFLVLLDNMCFDYPRISAPHLRFLGSGGSATAPKKLEGEFEQFVSAANDGVIILAFGSQEYIKAIFDIVSKKVFEALEGLKERVIVQYDATGKVNIPDNVLARPWLPQNDILGHPKTKLFISHCGANSQMEALYHAVPIICIPFQIEQEYNSARVENKGYGTRFDIQDFKPDDLRQTIRNVIDNSGYSNNIKKCSSMLRSMPSAQKTFLFWAEHVIEFGSDHLKPPSVGMPLYQLFMLDVIAFLLLILFISFAFIICCIQIICQRCICRSTVKEKQKTL